MQPLGEDWASERVAARLSEELRRAHEALRLSEARLAAIVESSEDAIVGESLDGVIETWNGGAERLYGYSGEEARGKNRAILTPPDRSWELEWILKQIRRRASVEHYPTKRLRKDGTLVDVSLTVSPILDPGGQMIGTASIARDITEGKMVERMKASLKEKEVLLKEVHHRVKNNLQVISSLLNLQARHVLDSKALEMFKESQNRVRSIALFHEKLYQSKDLAHVEAAGYLKMLIANLLAAYGAKPNAAALEVTPGDILLGVDVAIPLGLVVNELISNALKHAFPEGRLGEIRVQLCREEQNRYRLVVGDNGMGFPTELDFRNAPSLGLQLVCTLVDQLEGTIGLSREQGTSFQVAFEVRG